MEDIYIESVLEKVKKHPIEELVEIFLSSPNVNSYFILYLIAKSEERLPRKYSELLFDKKELFSNRRAIIFTFAIAQILEPAAKELIN